MRKEELVGGDLRNVSLVTADPKEKKKRLIYQNKNY